MECIYEFLWCWDSGILFGWIFKRLRIPFPRQVFFSLGHELFDG